MQRTITEEARRVEELLLDHLRTEVLRDRPEIEIHAETHLAEAGVLDSLGFINFIAFMEQRCGVSFTPEDFNPENLATVRRCARYVLSRQTPVSPSPERSGDPAEAVREAQREDLPTVTALWQELNTQHAAYDSSWQVTDTAAQHFRDSLERSLGSPHVILLVAEDSGAVAGFVYGIVKPEAPWFRERTVGTIVSICVSPGVRNRRPGRALVAAALTRFRAKAVQRVETAVADQNDGALSFWEKVGFRGHTRVYSIRV
jgi:ribosomal protein S18 acetylase RimI-like enzyme/acyl carrier protein